MQNLSFFLSIIYLSIGCSPLEESISFDSTLPLVFSNDTITFDTLLSQRRSSTKRLMVYNPNKNAIQLNEIALGKNENSEYTVVINGKKGNSVINERIYGGDSIIILVHVNIKSRNENLPFLIKDSLIFRWNTNEDHVKLISYGQEGIKLMNTSICNEVWNNDRPYIISDTLLIPPECQLSIEKGTIIYFENNASMYVQGTLKALGDSTDHIILRNTRLDGIYNEIPGQWNGIYFLEGSVNNEINYAEIFNAQTGLRVGIPDEDGLPDLIVRNTKIYNMSIAGILAFTSNIEVINSLIYNCGTYLVGGYAGGTYRYQHCTFSNESTLFIQNGPSVLFTDNILLDNNEVFTSNLTVKLTNCIIWGTQKEELELIIHDDKNIDILMTSNIIKSSLEFTNNYTSQKSNFPGFIDSFSNNYSLDSLSFAKDKASPSKVIIDINGSKRDINPDIGAFERIK